VFGQISIATSITRPPANRLTNVAGVACTRGAEANRRIQLKLCSSSAVSKTAGITVENERVDSRLNSSGLNNSPPRYSQFAVRRLKSSNSHHTGADITKRYKKFLDNRDQNEVSLH